MKQKNKKLILLKALKLFHCHNAKLKQLWKIFYRSVDWNKLETGDK
jgi:hypothetical protein